MANHYLGEMEAVKLREREASGTRLIAVAHASTGIGLTVLDVFDQLRGCRGTENPAGFGQSTDPVPAGLITSGLPALEMLATM